MKQVYFGEIAIGDVFQWASQDFVKTQEFRGKNTTTHLESIFNQRDRVRVKDSERVIESPKVFVPNQTASKNPWGYSGGSIAEEKEDDDFMDDFGDLITDRIC